MIRFLAALLVLLLGSIGTVSAQPSGCTTTTCTGSALSSGFLSVSGNQFVNGLGQTQRLVCAEFKGKPGDGTMPAIRAAGFNCIRIDWHDAYLGAAITPTFTDPFTSLSLHQNWQAGDLWGIGATFDNGIGQGGPFLGDFGSQWWVNPFNPNTAFGSCGSNCYAGGLYQISPSGTLELGLSNIPSGMQAYINTTSQCNGTCSGSGGNLSYLGAIVNNQNTNTQQFGDYRLTVAVDKLAGADFQWDIESYNGTTNTNNPPEIDLGIYTDASNVMHTYLQIAGGSQLFNATSPTFDPSVPHNYELNWQSDFITFYVDGVQQGQVATSSQPAVYSSGNPMFSYLLSAANYRSGTNPTTNAATLAAWHAHVSAFSVYQNQPSGSGSGIANGLGCNTLTDIATCVANANAAGLKVVFSHRGNEVPTGPCITRQANGLWFDSGLDSGGNDGCIAGAGNYTFGQFQTDTANLLGAYAGNSTVIGYEMHHQPLVVGAYTGTGGGGTGAFTVSNGQVLAPDGSVFHAFGVNIDWSASSGLSPPTVAAVQAAIPKLNHIRLAIGADGGGYQDSPSFASLEAYVATFTAKGIVVMIESHYTGQPSACSVNLSGEAAWYSRLATDLKSNNMVIFESGNELSGANTGGGCLTQEHQNVYNAIRGTGNNTVIALTTSNGNDFANGGAPETPSAYSTMTNIVWGQHYYNWMPNNSLGFPGMNNQSAVYADLAHQVVLGQQFATSASGAIPTLVTEGGYLDYAGVCGGSGSGQGNQIYNCGEGQVVQAFLTPTASNVVGGDFWLWFFTGCSSCTQTNVVTAQAGSANTFYGNTVNGIVSANSPGPIVFSGGGTGIPPVNWGGGGPTDVQAACSQVGAAVAAVNPGVIEFCPGPANNSTGTTLLSGATKPAGGGVGLSDISAAVTHPLTGLPAGKAAYSIDIYPTNLGGVTPDSPIGTTVPIWNAYFGNAAASVPVMDMETGCSCDGTNGNLADDNAMMTAWTSYANGSASGGPRFTTGQQPLSNTWLSWGYAPGVNPDGTLNSDLTTLKLGQQTWWSTLLFGSAGPPPPPTPTTWNPSDKSASITLSNNNLTATATANTSASVRSTASKSTGKLCFELTASTITSDWDVGLANASYALALAGGLGTDSNGIGFDPNSAGGSQGIFFSSPTPISTGAGISANGEKATVCADIPNQLAWFTTSAMRGAGNNWNNSPTANPATGTGGISFSGLTGPYFIAYNNFETGGVAVLNTTGSFAVTTPAGFSPWDNTTVTGRPSLMLILGSNDNLPGGIRLASNY